MKLKKIYENEDFIIYEDNKGYDFKYTIKNKTNKKIVYYLNGMDDYLILQANDFIGLFNGDYSEEYIRCILDGNCEKYSLTNEIYNIQSYLDNLKEESKEEIIKYVNYQLYWLKDIIEKIEN